MTLKFLNDHKKERCKSFSIFCLLSQRPFLQTSMTTEFLITCHKKNIEKLAKDIATIVGLQQNVTNWQISLILRAWEIGFVWFSTSPTMVAFLAMISVLLTHFLKSFLHFDIVSLSLDICINFFLLRDQRIVFHAHFYYTLIYIYERSPKSSRTEKIMERRIWRKI